MLLHVGFSKAKENREENKAGVLVLTVSSQELFGNNENYYLVIMKIKSVLGVILQLKITRSEREVDFTG